MSKIYSTRFEKGYLFGAILCNTKVLMKYYGPKFLDDMKIRGQKNY